MTLPDRLRLGLAFEPSALAADLDRLTEGWIPHFVPAHYDGDWSVIPLRAKAGATHPILMISSEPGATEFVDTAVLAGCPAIRAALAALECPLLSVRLMRLGPGSAIKPHVDADLAAEQGTVRLHLPIRTNPRVVFRLNGRPVVMAPGSLWYLRLSDPHAVENRGATERVHLVIDATMNAWLANRLAEAAAAEPEGMPEGGRGSGFAAFREAVFDDVHLRMRLRRPRDRVATVAEVVAEGMARGFLFDEAEVWATLRAGERTWLLHGTEDP